MKRVSVLMLAAVMVLVCAISAFPASSQSAYNRVEKRAKRIADSLHSLAESIMKNNKHAFEHTLTLKERQVTDELRQQIRR